MTREIFDALKAPFPPDAIEWRIGQSGLAKEKPYAKVLAYLTSRAVMDRLDEVLGPENWQDEYALAPHDPEKASLLCTLSIRINGEWIRKTDGANVTDIEPVKGCISDSLKRAAVKFGVGRYLYDLGDSWAECTFQNPGRGTTWRFAKLKDGKHFWWAPPELPAWALPAPDAAKTIARDEAIGKPATKGRDVHARGDDHDWRQWTSPPEIAVGKAHPWHCQALKGLRQHCGAGSTGLARTLYRWASGKEVPKPQLVEGSAEQAKEMWACLMAKHQQGIEFTAMLRVAQESLETAST